LMDRIAGDSYRLNHTYHLSIFQLVCSICRNNDQSIAMIDRLQ
jgi:hypothetical protein